LPFIIITRLILSSYFLIYAFYLSSFIILITLLAKPNYNTLRGVKGYIIGIKYTLASKSI